MKQKSNKLERDILKILSSGNWGILEISLLSGVRDLDKLQKVLDKLVSEGKIVKHKYLYSLK